MKKPIPIGKAINIDVSAESCRGERFLGVSILPKVIDVKVIVTL
jgi:hypothetical protein